MLLSIKYSILVLFLTIGLCACYNSSKKADAYFYYNESSGIASLDPAFAKNQSIMWPVHQLYNTLVEVDSNLNIKPSIAKRWVISADKKTYTFYLRNDVFFHNDPAFKHGRGRKLTADDVVYSFQRIINARTASPGAWIFNNRIDETKGFKKVDDTTFTLTLVQPYHPVLGILSMQYCSIVPKEAVDTYGVDFRRHPVGTGPFQFVAWEEGLALILKRNPNYFEKDKMGQRLPYLQGVKVSFYDSKATEFLLFRQKKLHFINDIDASFKDEVLTKKGVLRKGWEDKMVLQTHPFLNVEYLGFLTDTSNSLIKGSAIRLKNVRQAINYGFDREKMILYLRNSLGLPAHAGFIPAGLPSFDSTQVKGYNYNPKLAKKLLADVGISPSSKMQLKLLTIPVYADMADYISKQLGELGIDLQVEVIQKSLLLQMTSNSTATFFRGSWIADYPDAENYLSVFYSKNPAPPNYTRYKNDAFDRLFEKALSETNDSARYHLYRQADNLLMADAPVVPLWYDMVIRLVQPEVKNFTTNALNGLELRTVKIVE